jgi:exosortase A
MSASAADPRHVLAATLRPAAPALAAGIVAWVLLFHEEIARAVAVWDASTAYGHCWFVLPIALYLAWDRRVEAAGVPLRSTPWPLVLALPGALVWLTAERIGIMEGRQLAAVGLLILIIVAVLGWRLAWVFSAALLYLFFLVPFGAFVTSPLQRFTAAFIDVGLSVLGIPHVMDQFTIEIPAGAFYVAEACAGLRFLIAAIAFGVLYACLIYRSPWRRAAFIATSCVVPVIANGFRALGIVVLGEILGSAEAAAADHIIYGWVFFSLVILLLILAGLPFRQDTAPPAPPAAIPALPRGPSPWPAAVLLAGAAALGPAVAALLEFNAAPAAAALPAFAAPPGCTALAAGGAAGVQRFVCGRLRLTAGIRAFAARANPGEVLLAERAATGEGHAEDVRLARLAGWRLAETQDPDRSTATRLWIDGRPSPGGMPARFAQARNSLLGGTFAPVLIWVSATGDERMSRPQRQAARQAIGDFLNAQGDLETTVAALAAAAAR